MRRICCATAACCVLLTGALLPAEADAQRPPASAERERETRLEEVVVTAQKREQRLQDVASSVSVVDETTIHDAGVSQIDDLVLLTPGLDFSQTLGRQNTHPLIRGVAPQFLTDPTVVVFIDGFSLGFTRLVNNSLLSDLERIEVLKGPQATLYGRNALGGVINYVTKKPSETLGGSVSADYGSYDSYQASASITGPIAANRLYGRLGVATRGRGGTVDNAFDGARDVNGERDISARGTLRWVLTDDLEVNVTETYGKGNDHCGDCSHVSRLYDVNNPNRFRDIGAGLLDFNDTARTTNMSYLGGYDREDTNTVVNATYTQPRFSVTSISGYGRIDTLLRGDSNGPTVGTFVPGAPGYAVPIKIDGWSEELRFASNGKSRFTWLAGLYAYHSTNESSLLFNTFVLTADRSKVANYAGFANGEYALTERFSIAAGLRYDTEKREDLNRTNFNAPSNLLRSKNASEVLPRLSISYKPSSRMHLYGTIARGYHVGGFNALDAPALEFDSEYVWNYEIGLKGGFRDNRLQVQLAAFYIDWTGQQINQAYTRPVVGGTELFKTNAGASEIHGFEASMQWSPNERFSLSTSLALMGSELKEFQDPATAPTFGLNPDFSGNELPFAPKVAATVSGQYLVPLSAAGWRARLRADVRYMDKRFFDPTNLIRANAYWLANLYAGVQNERYEVGLFADNVFDEEYLTGGQLPNITFPPEVTLGDPRIYGIRVNARF